MRLAGTQKPSQQFAEEKRIDCRQINQSVPRLSEGRSSNEMVTNDTILLQSIFMIGGAPPRMLNSVVKNSSENTTETQRTQRLHRENLKRGDYMSTMSQAERT